MSQSFLPSASPTILRTRAALLRQIRTFFDDRDFVEVETPILSADPVVDRHLDPIPVTLFSDARNYAIGKQLWLQTSPEFGMKRILAAGLPKIYQITRAFRGAEVGRIHNPEFTMVEWYRAGDDLVGGMNLLSELIMTVLEQSTPCERLTYRAAFERAVGVDPFQTSVSDLRRQADRLNVAVPETLSASDRDAWLDLFVSEIVSPGLGVPDPVIVYDFPATQAALARVRPSDPPVAERFELFAGGMELANGYHELLDPEVLRARQVLANQDRIKDGKSSLPEENQLLLAMEFGLPASAGTALGFDRLVMYMAGVQSIREVMAFPIDRA